MLYRIIYLILGIKVIKHNTSNINKPDDTTLPFKLEVVLRTPEFMTFTFIAMYGGVERLVVRGRTRWVLDWFVRKHDLRTHHRLQLLTITGPGKVILEKIDRMAA